MYKKHLKNRLPYIILMPIGIILFLLAAYQKNFIESYYSNSVYKILGQIISNITGVFPFSLGELTIVALAIFLLYKISRIVMLLLVSNKKKSVIYNALLNMFKYITITYIIFIFIWGFNYHRLPFADIAGLEIKPASIEDLKQLCEILVNQANNLKDTSFPEKVNSNAKNYVYPDVFKRAPLGYIEASKKYPQLSGKYGSPKSVLMSEFLSYAGIAGIYFPFTGEANVNTKIPYFMLPNTTCHEMAHQRGFAREDEANYIAYLTCMANPNSDFKYSGTMLALIYSMNALQKYDMNSFNELTSKYSDDVKQDLLNLNLFWAKYDGPIERTSDKINNAYLKANLQKDGIHSYGRMVDLLIAGQKKDSNH